MGTRTKPSDAPVLSARELRAITKVLADPRRFEIFRQIAALPIATCGDLRKDCPITAATLSHHLKELEASGVIEITRTGKFISASVRRDVWNAYLAELQAI